MNLDPKTVTPTDVINELDNKNRRLGKKALKRFALGTLASVAIVVATIVIIDRCDDSEPAEEN